MIVVVKTREQMKTEQPPVLNNSDGSLTRAGAVSESRNLWGDLGTISGDDKLPRLVWCIGQFDRTIGRGRTWEIALDRSRARKAKLDQKQLAQMRDEAAHINVETLVKKVKVTATDE
jgi:hypothetical protein